MSKWDELSMAEKAEMMKVAIMQGITNLSDIRQKYNEFAEGGSEREVMEDNTDTQYINTMEKVAEENYRNWGYNNPDEALIHALNDNTYNYRGYYNKYSQSKANADTHWTDEFKTVWHPTFSNESIYSGKKSQYNPQGLTGGFWIDETFFPAVWQTHQQKNLFYPGGNKQNAFPYRYVLTDDDKWNRVSNDEIGRVFQGLTVTPRKSKYKFIPEKIDNSLEAAQQRDKFYQYRDEDGNLKGEPGLQIISPEFDIITLGSAFKNFGKGMIRNNFSNKKNLFSTSSSTISDGKTVGVTRMNQEVREVAAQRMRDFINSPEFQNRIERAGLQNDKDYIIGLIEKRLKGENLPAWEADIISGSKSIKGLSEVDRFLPDYGVTIRKGMSPEEFAMTIDHELAHWTTENTFSGFWEDLVQSFLNRKMPNLRIQKLMRYDNRLAPIRGWKDYYNNRFGNIAKDQLEKMGEQVAKAKKRFKYVRNSQERRARAYEMYQEAQRRGLTTDQLVDMYTVEGDILGEAPQSLRDLGMVYTPDNLKKYLNGFLSISAPVTIGLNSIEYE